MRFRALRQPQARPLAETSSTALAVIGERPSGEHMLRDMTVLRMDNVLIVVEDIDGAKRFFAELGLELEGETTVEGPWVDQTVGLTGVRADIVMLMDRSP